MRVRRICSTDFEFERHVTDMNLRFKKREYPEKWIHETKDKLVSLNRYDLLEYWNFNPHNLIPIIFIP